MLRDKLVNWLKDIQTQKQFLEINEDKLTREKVEQIALAMENANKNVKLLNLELAQEEVPCWVCLVRTNPSLKEPLPIFSGGP